MRPCSGSSAGPRAQKVLGPPAGTLRRPTCSLYCVLQVELALLSNSPQFLQHLFAGPKWPSGGPQEAFKRPPCSHALRRPTRGTHARTHARTQTRAHACVLAVRSTSVRRVLHAGMLCSCCAALCPCPAPVPGPLRHGICDYTALSITCISPCSRRRMHPGAAARPLGPQTQKGTSLRSSRCTCRGAPP